MREVRKSWVTYNWLGGSTTWRLAPPDVQIDAFGVVWGVPRDAPQEDQVHLCMGVLAGLPASKTPRVFSYWAKHVVENALKTYISNGAFIEAARRVGLPIACAWNNPNAMVFVKKRDFIERLLRSGAKLDGIYA